MTEVKHTPGPWHVFDRVDTLEIQAKGGKAVVHWMGFDDTGFPRQNRANAHLIAAAPDLLSALEALGALPEGYCFCFNNNRDATRPEHEHTGECRAARAALTKARAENKKYVGDLPECDRSPLEKETQHARTRIEYAVLRVIAQGSSGFGPMECFWSFRNIVADTGLPREYVRAACRSLTDQGLAEYSAGLSNEDGDFRGAGYGVTKAGLEYLNQIGDTT